MRGAIAIVAGLMALAAAAPAAADVKAGVDAWAKGDFKGAVDQWRAPAIAGDPDAQFNMGQAYKLGRGVPADLKQAQGWFRKAAEQGHAQAQDNLGLALFQDGQKDAARPWLEKSAARDEKRAELVLGTMLFNGDGVAKDYTRAYALVTRSSQQGLTQGSQTLAQMDQYITPEQRQAGLTMATRIEADGRTARAATTAPPPLPGTALPPPPTQLAATASAPKPAASPKPTTSAKPPAPKPAPTKVAAAPKPAPTPKPTAKPTPAKPAVATGNGKWRVQLGAFRDEGNAKGLWSKVGARVGGKPDYVKAGGMVRLQATGFATRAEAQAACSKAGRACVVVAP